MKLVIQRVIESRCDVDQKCTGKSAKGFMVLVGFTQNDDETICQKMALKLSKLRIFEDDNGKMNLDIHEVKGSILSISQFTLYADCKRGNRPSFTNAMSGEQAIGLYQYFNDCLRKERLIVEEGIFGADMKISLINDGPVTIILDSKEIV